VVQLTEFIILDDSKIFAVHSHIATIWNVLR